MERPINALGVAPLVSDTGSAEHGWLGASLGKLLTEHLSGAGLPAMHYNAVGLATLELDIPLPLDTVQRPAFARRGFHMDTTRPFALLEAFMRHPGELLSRYRLLELAWDMAFESRSNVVDVYVRYLREKIDRPFGADSIETVRGSGYRFRVAGAP